MVLLPSDFEVLGFTQKINRENYKSYEISFTPFDEEHIVEVTVTRSSIRIYWRKKDFERRLLDSFNVEGVVELARLLDGMSTIRILSSVNFFKNKLNPNVEHLLD